ncbi:MAG: MopE-related protein, partial [Deltaproteobacteria bacterium]
MLLSLRRAKWALVSATVLASSVASAQTTIVKPEFLLIVDTSGSMTSATTGTGNNSCGFPRRRINDAACVVQHIADGVGDAIFGLETFSFACSNTPTAAGDHYGYTTNFSCGAAGAGTGTLLAGTTCTDAPAALPAPLSTATGYPFPYYGCYDSSLIDVNIASTTQYELRSWGDGSFTSCTALPTAPAPGGNELSTVAGGSGLAVSNTPLAGALLGALRYLNNSLGATHRSPYVNFDGTTQPDPYPACRPVNVILLTDGAETCVNGGSIGAQAEARNVGCLRVDLNGNGLLDNPIPATDPNVSLRGKYESNVDLNGDGDCYDTVAGAPEQRAFRTRVYTIGFGVTCPDAAMDAIATAGGIAPHTVAGCAGVHAGYYATSEAEIATAINDIIADSALRELCNGRDDNCNGIIDEGFALGGACTVGVGACARTGASICNVAGDATTCNAVAGAPGVENTNALCSDGIDNNCDGRIDCADAGCAATPRCAGGCTLVQPEVCDGRDNNCNGLVDEGGITRPCGSTLGVCTAGTQTCQPQTLPGTGVPVWGACTGTTGSAEVCDGLDNNCNGVADEGLSRACGSSVGACRAGVQLCVGGTYSGACIGSVGPSAEVCDGVDNNCDGTVDNGIPAAGACGAAGVGVCTAGTIQCVGGSLQCVGGTRPGTETCNGLDDDCNGVVDDGIASAACTPTGITFPTTPPTLPCRQGMTACRMGATVCLGAQGPVAEVCDGIDNDCNGVIDDGLTGAPCGTSVGVCTVGMLQCVAGHPMCVGSVGPSPEVCNNLDDNCNGMTDEANPGGGGPCGATGGECAPGVLVCTAGALVCNGGRSAVPEVCNGLDDDCNGMIDDGIPDRGPCGSNVGICHEGVSRCTGGVFVCVGGVGPRPTEECNCLDDNCDGVVDNGATGGAGLCGTGGAVCAGAPYCQCLRPCAQTEFPCPIGRTCADVAGQQLCVGDPCADVSCATTQHCINGACLDWCSGVTCNGGLVCDPHSGRCVENGCRVLNNCTGGLICVSNQCVPDPCLNVTCMTGQYCSSGACLALCGTLTCPSGQVCHAGVCAAPNRCDMLATPCGATQTCDPTTGRCVTNVCGTRGCGAGQTCNPVNGACVDDPCQLVRCPVTATCVMNGTTAECREAPHEPRERVIGSGGGGATCSVGRTPGR